MAFFYYKKLHFPDALSINQLRKIKVRPDNGEESMLLINHSIF